MLYVIILQLFRILLNHSLVVSHFHSFWPLHSLKLAQNILVPLSPFLHRQHPRPVDVLHALRSIQEVLSYDQPCPA